MFVRAYYWIRRFPSYRNFGVGPADARLIPSYAASLAMVVIATIVRMIADPFLPSGFPFLTYFPAIIVAAFVLGLWPSILAMVLGATASWYLFIPPFYSFLATTSSFTAVGFFLLVTVVDIYISHLAISALVDADKAGAERDRLAKFQDLMIRELDHRIKNLFTIAASIVKISSQYAETPRDLADDAGGRIMALSRAHSSLWRSEKDAEATVQTVAHQILEPYLRDYHGKVAIGGRSPALTPQLVQILSLVFHELATNAVKYGALQQHDGDVSVSAEIEPPNGFAVLWSESAETAGAAPQRTGFGTELIERLVSGAGGEIERRIENGRMTMRFSFSNA
jgi:two-component sensor histidine kinase